MSSTTNYDDTIEVISTRGASCQLNDDSGYAGSNYSASRHQVMERYCELGAENQLCGQAVLASNLRDYEASSSGANAAHFINIPPKRFILQSDEEIIRNCYANGRAARGNNEGHNAKRPPSYRPPPKSAPETCLIPPPSKPQQKKEEAETQTPTEKRVARMIVVVAGVFLLASFVLVGVTLSMSAHIDEMGGYNLMFSSERSEAFVCEYVPFVSYG